MKDMVLWVACKIHTVPQEFCTVCKTAIDMNVRQGDALGVPVQQPWATPDGRRPWEAL